MTDSKPPSNGKTATPARPAPRAVPPPPNTAKPAGPTNGSAAAAPTVTPPVPRSRAAAELAAFRQAAATKADEIVAPFGGMFYRQEAPGWPSFVIEGQHFDKGQPVSRRP